MPHSEVVDFLLLLVCYFSSGPPSPGRIKERKLDEFYPRNFLDTFIQLNAWEKNPPFKKSVNIFNWKSCTSPCLNVNYRFRMAILRNNHFFLSLQGIKFTLSSSPSFSIQEKFFPIPWENRDDVNFCIRGMKLRLIRAFLLLLDFHILTGQGFLDLFKIGFFLKNKNFGLVNY